MIITLISSCRRENVLQKSYKKWDYSHAAMTDEWLIAYTAGNQNKIAQHVHRGEKTNSSSMLDWSVWGDEHELAEKR